MNIRNRNLFIIFCFIVLISGCGNQLTIQSATSEMVVIKAPVGNFIDAYDLAKKKCQENTKNAVYIPDYSADINIVAFNCVGEEVEEVATESETTPAETEEEAPTGAEEAPAETDAATADTEEVPAVPEEDSSQ